MTQVSSVLLVEDQDDLRDALSDQLLVTQEFMVEQAANGQEALHHIAQKSFDLIILDVGLPDTDGRELCKVMRKQNVKCPIVMLTGHDWPMCCIHKRLIISAGRIWGKARRSLWPIA